MRGTRHPGLPDTKYATPVSHSHQLLCVPLIPPSRVTSLGLLGSAVFQISCAELPNVRSMYTAPASALGSDLPSHTRTICAPPCSARPASPGMCASSFGWRGSVTSRSDVPLDS